MRPPSSTQRSWNGRRLTITSLKPIERDGRIRDAIAKRAFQICESRGGSSGHQLEDWRRADSEILRPLNCGYLVADDKIELSTDAASFGEGEIEICVQPRRLMICEKEQICKPGGPREKIGSSMNRDLVFWYLDLPLEIEPSEVTAKFRGRTLEIDLPKAHTMEKSAIEKHAA